nr:hypothetical protein [Actinosynnema sp. ALI-1.44]
MKETRGFDFTGYKRRSLARRVLRRMSQVGRTSASTSTCCRRTRTNSVRCSTPS